MEITPPEHPIRSWREFLSHILTVTCGILIALGLEQMVELHRAHTLAGHARADFRAELANNREKIEATRASDHANGDWLASLTAYGEARLKPNHPKLGDPKGPPATERTFVMLPTSAWEVAVATQAVNQLDFGEARALSAAYNRIAVLNGLSAQARSQWIELSGWRGSDPATLSDGDLRTLLRILYVGFAYAHSLEARDTSVLAAIDTAAAVLKP